MIMFTDLFAFISFKCKKTRMSRKFVIFQNFEKLPIFKFAYFFRDYQILTNFITVSYWTLIVLLFLKLNLFVSGLD